MVIELLLTGTLSTQGFVKQYVNILFTWGFSTISILFTLVIYRNISPPYCLRILNTICVRINNR